MKKLSILFAMMFVASMAMAQSTVTITQNGTGNNANYTQVSSYGDVNTIHAAQMGNWNILTTSQTGYDNNLDLWQNGDRNTATMSQFTNDVDHLFEPAGHNNAVITQSGHYNGATLTQREAAGWIGDFSKNTATAIQSGTYNGYILNQGSELYKPLNIQYLTQSGVSNGADVNQIGYKNESQINQSGNWNVADLDQDGGYVWPEYSAGWDKSISWQGGDRNTLAISQSGNAILQYAETYQGGNYNGTTVKQVGVMGEQTIWSQQNGNYNGIIGTQTDF